LRERIEYGRTLLFDPPEDYEEQAAPPGIDLEFESFNSLSSFVDGVKTQLGDHEGLGGAASSDEDQTILAGVKDTTDSIDENGATANVEDVEEKLAGTSPSPPPSFR
jgi:hypothetical protein